MQRSEPRRSKASTRHSRHKTKQVHFIVIRSSEVSSLPDLALRRPGGYGEGINTRSHPELGRENPQRQWYCVLRRGRVGRLQVFSTQDQTTIPPAQNAFQTTLLQPTHPHAGWSSPVARQAHNLKVVGSNPTPATT